MPPTIQRAEDGGVGADAECQRKHDGRREAWRFAMQAQAVQPVVQDG